MFRFNGTWLSILLGVFFAISNPLVNAEYEDFDDCLAQTYYNYDLCLDYSYDCGDCCDYEKDHCKINEHKCDTCLHKEFPKETIQDQLGQDVRTCCAGHGYIFRDQCEVIIILLIYG